MSRWHILNLTDPFNILCQTMPQKSWMVCVVSVCTELSKMMFVYIDSYTCDIHAYVCIYFYIIHVTYYAEVILKSKFGVALLYIGLLVCFNFHHLVLRHSLAFLVLPSAFFQFSQYYLSHAVMHQAFPQAGHAVADCLQFFLGPVFLNFQPGKLTF